VGVYTEEVLQNIQELVEMVVEELIEDRVAIPREPTERVRGFGEQRVAVTI
jgi:predicted RNase H-like HicB family nuclease